MTLGSRRAVLFLQDHLGAQLASGIEGQDSAVAVAATTAVRDAADRFALHFVGGVTPSRALGASHSASDQTVIGFHVVGVQTAEEFPNRPLGSEHVNGHMLTVLRNDFVFVRRL